MNLKTQWTINFILLFLAATSSDALAHASASHVMSFSAGLLHFITQTDHLLLAAPVIALILAYCFRKRITDLFSTCRVSNDRF